MRCGDPVVWGVVGGRITADARVLVRATSVASLQQDSAGNTIVHICAEKGFTEILHLYLSQYP